MSLSSAANNPQYNDPNSTFMQGQSKTVTDNPSGELVTSGAGGSSVVISRDALIPPGPSQLGLTGTQQGMGATFAGTIQADFPSLMTGTSTINFGDILSNLLGPAQPSTDTDNDDSAISFFSSKSGPSTSTAFTISNNSSAPTSTDASALRKDSSDELANGVDSTDPNTVLTALMSYSNVDDNPLLTPDQKKVISNKLQILSKEIAEKNSSGDDTALKSANPEVLLSALKDLLQMDKDPSLSDDDKSTLTDCLSTIASSMGALNGASGANPPANEMYTDMNSTSADDVYTALSKMASTSGGLTSAQLQELSPQLKALALKISQSNPPGVPGLESPSPQTIIETLTNLIGAENNPLISDGTKTLLKLFVSTVSSKIAGNNKDVFTEMTFSTDPKVVDQALVVLSNVRYNKSLSPSEVSATEDYLKILAKALAFMSSVRATIVTLEAQFRKAEAAGKLGTISDQNRLSLISFNKGMKQISTQLEKNIHEIEKQKILKILFPFITLIMAIIAVILIVVTLGAATPVAIALIAMTVALASFTLLDQTTGMIEKACKASHIKDDAAKAAINLGVQVAVAVVACIFTFGLAAPMMAGDLTLNSIIQSLKTMGSAMANATRAEGAMMGLTGVSMLFSSGIVTAALTKIFKAAGMSDELAAAMAMLLSLIIMLTVLVAAVKMIGNVVETAAKTGVGGAGGGAAAAKDVTQAAETTLSEVKQLAANAKNAEQVARASSETAHAKMLTTAEDARVQGTVESQQIAEEAAEAATVAAAKAADASTELTQALQKVTDAEQALLKAQIAEAAIAAEETTARSAGQVDNAPSGAGVAGSVTGASAGDTAVTNSSQISRMIQNSLERIKEIFKNSDINSLMRIVMALQAAASAAEFVTTIATNVQSIQLNKQQIELTKEITAAQAGIEELKTLVPFFDTNMDAVTEDSKKFISFFSDLLNLFAQMVASASAITTQMHRTS